MIDTVGEAVGIVTRPENCAGAEWLGQHNSGVSIYFLARSRYVQMTNDYHFLTHWQVVGKIEDVYDLISDPLHYRRWWPAVYLGAEELEHGDENGVGRRFRLCTKGFLPYALRWESCTIEATRPHRLQIRATGDFDGRGIWTLQQNGRLVDVEFDWTLTAEKPLIRHLSFLLKPLFSANHRWAMARGQEGLARELKRRN
jgi:uncharacterized protein YndB with AHSA1/START domain